MRETLYDQLREAAGESSQRQSSWRRLRGAAWLDHALWIAGVDEKVFTERFIHRGRSASNLLAKWKSGATLPSRPSAIALEKSLPGTLGVFDLPLWELLADNPLPGSFVRGVLAKLRTKVPYGWQWDFPGLPTRSPSLLPNDSASLVSRGDIWGLTAIVGLVREAEAARNALSHVELSKDMFRALPSALKLPWMAPSADLLQGCVDRIRMREPLSAAMFDVDWSVIAGQVASPNYQAGLNRCPTDQGIQTSIDFADPILEAKLMRGYRAKEEQLAREKRR